MPYQLEKGPIWSVVESALAAGPSAAYELLQLLRDPNQPIANGPLVSSTTLDYVDTSTSPPFQSNAQVRAEHLNKHWFGMTKDQSGQWKKEPDSAFDPQTHPSTGFWINYWGDVESVVRETFVRAIEVSLGIKHGRAHRGSEFRRNWPISIYLKCPTPWFEGWVTWRSWTDRAAPNARDGQVTVHFLVPGNYGSQVLKQPTKGLNGKPDTKPETSDDPNGMWLVTHTTHTRVSGVVTTDPGTAGDIHAPSPGPIIRDEGPVVVLSPTEFDGGVAQNGRPYVPGP